MNLLTIIKWIIFLSTLAVYMGMSYLFFFIAAYHFKTAKKIAVIFFLLFAFNFISSCFIIYYFIQNPLLKILLPIAGLVPLWILYLIAKKNQINNN